MEDYLFKQRQLKRCSVHELLYGGYWPNEDFKKKALKDYKKGMSGPFSKLSNLNEDAFVNLLKSVLEHHSTPRCPLSHENNTSD